MNENNAKMYDDPDFWERVWTRMASTTDGLDKIAAEEGIAYQAFYHAIYRNPARKERYEEAKKAQALQHAAKVGHILERLEGPVGDEAMIDPARARELIRGHQWLAEVKDRETFGSQKAPLVQLNFDVAGLQALRQLASAPLPAIEGEYEVVPERVRIEADGPDPTDIDRLLE